MAEIGGAFHRARVAGTVSAPGATYRAQAPLYPKRRAALAPLGKAKGGRGPPN
jgi:hypothetical protein